MADYLRQHRIAGPDPAEFTRAWRENYYRRVADAPRPLDPRRRVIDEYAAGFTETCVRFGLAEPDDAAAEVVSRSWQRLTPWPDVRAGMGRLQARSITATLSNADTSTVVGVFKEHRIPVDAIFTAEMFGAFKPDPQVYLGALRYLDVRPDEAAMVASHPYDLYAAASLGLGTVFVHRPDEYGDPALSHRMDPENVDQYVESIGEIA